MITCSENLSWLTAAAEEEVLVSHWNWFYLWLASLLLLSSGLYLHSVFLFFLMENIGAALAQGYFEYRTVEGHQCKAILASEDFWQRGRKTNESLHVLTDVTLASVEKETNFCQSICSTPGWIDYFSWSWVSCGIFFRKVACLLNFQWIPSFCLFLFRKIHFFWVCTTSLESSRGTSYLKWSFLVKRVIF